MDHSPSVPASRPTSNGKGSNTSNASTSTPKTRRPFPNKPSLADLERFRVLNINYEYAFDPANNTIIGTYSHCPFCVKDLIFKVAKDQVRHCMGHRGSNSRSGALRAPYNDEGGAQSLADRLENLTSDELFAPFRNKKCEDCGLQLSRSDSKERHRREACVKRNGS